MSVDGSSSACCLSILGSSFDELIFCRSVAQAQDYEPDRVAAGTVINLRTTAGGEGSSGRVCLRPISKF